MNANQPVLAIANYGDFETDVLTVLQTNQDVMTHVVSQEARYKTINVAESMTKLATVGELLGVAYMGSKGFKCNVQVTALMADYQTLGKDSQIACQQFLMASMQALKYHRMALQLIQKMKPSNALKILGMISKIAEDMSAIAGTLAKRAEDMCKLAKDALVAASNDNVISTERKQQIQRQIAELEAQAARYKETAEYLASTIGEARDKENEAARQADQARKDAFAIALVGTILGPIKDVAKTVAAAYFPTGAMAGAGGSGSMDKKTPTAAPTVPTVPTPQAPPPVNSPEYARLTTQITEKKGQLAKTQAKLASENDDKAKDNLKAEIAQIQAEIQSLEENRQQYANTSAATVLQNIKKDEANSAAEREAQFHAERVKLQEQDRQVKADLAESLQKLKSTGVEGDQLDKALQSLDVAIKALGQIKTVFENTRIYWIAVRDHCAELAREGTNMKDFTEEGLEDLFAEAITNSWYSWLALAKTNYNATIAMKSVMGKVDGVMNDLPTTSEIKQRLEGTISKLENELMLDNQASAP